VGVDELDKIDDDEQAVQLLNDTKALFGVDDCYFVFSVSLSAVAKFEQRGLPFQDAFESALDEVIRVEPLGVRESLELLQRRLIGIPDRWVIVCHVLAGGLPRDIIRLARKLLSYSQIDGCGPERRLIYGEVAVKVRALETRHEILNEAPGERIRFLRALTDGPMSEDKWVREISSRMTGNPDCLSTADDFSRTLVLAAWATTLASVVSGHLRLTELNELHLTWADRLSRARLLLTYDISGALSLVNLVRATMGLQEFPAIASGVKNDIEVVSARSAG
jgi:hypothetical protein